jgi:hypothetical protein
MLKNTYVWAYFLSVPRKKICHTHYKSVSVPSEVTQTTAFLVLFLHDCHFFIQWTTHLRCWGLFFWSHTELAASYVSPLFFKSCLPPRTLRVSLNDLGVTILTQTNTVGSNILLLSRATWCMCLLSPSKSFVQTPGNEINSQAVL